MGQLKSIVPSSGALISYDPKGSVNARRLRRRQNQMAAAIRYNLRLS
jgi:hypothetical protein